MAPTTFWEAFKEEPDMAKRDPNDLNDHLKVSFEEVIGEPDHTHSVECVWRYSYKCFNMWKTLCYCIATLICGIPIASCWGCNFACIAFQHIWDITPQLAEVRIQCGVIRKYCQVCLSVCLDPCCESCGKIFEAFRKN